MTTVYPKVAVTNDATILRLGATQLLDGIEENMMVTSQDGLSQYTIAGGGKPWPGIQDGIIVTGGIKGLSPSFKHIDLKSARQPGVTWTGTNYDVLEIDMQLEAHANSPQGLSALVSDWMSIWQPEMLNTFEYWTLDRGYWYFPARRSKPFPDTLKQLPRMLRRQTFTQSIRCDSGFWYGFPSTSQFPTVGSPLTSGAGQGFLPLINIGNQDGWPTILFYGPGTSTFSNGPTSTTMITFGPLEAGQIVLMRTLPRLRTLSNLVNPPATTPAASQNLIDEIINFVTNNNVPPLLQWFESLFGGTVPSQGNLYQLLNGRYSNPIPGVRQPTMATPSHLAVSISGGSSASRIVGRLDPQRDWPE